jgi:hypothetical protein
LQVGDSPLASLANKWDLCTTVMSLRDPGNPKKTMPNPQVMGCYGLKHSGWIMNFASIKPLHGFGQFFHFQCIQSELPSMPDQPLFSFIPINLMVSSSFGEQRYFRPNTWMIVFENNRTDFMVVSSPMV